MGGFRFEEQFLPLLVVTAPSSVDASDLDALFARFEGRFALQTRYALLLDLTGVQHIPPASLRKKIGDWETRHAAETKRWNVGAAIVVRSALVRGALTALSWLATDASPRTHVASTAEGILWCCRKLEAENVPITPALAKLRLEPHELAS